MKKNKKTAELMPVVSVCMITYNHEPYIEQAINSILKQKTSFRFELIVGEDSSTDGTKHIVEEYVAEHPDTVSLVSSEENVGAIKNLKRVIEKSKGKYITFCEGDDYWHNDRKLEEQVLFLEKNLDFGLVHSDLDHLYETENEKIQNYNKVNNNLIPTGFIYDKLLNPKNYIIKTVTVCLRKELISSSYFELIVNKGWKLGDLPLWLSIATKSKIGYIDKSLATYRILPESASHSRSVRNNYVFHKMVFEVRKHFLELNGGTIDVYNHINSHYYSVLFRDTFFLSQRKEMNYYFLKYRKLPVKIPVKFYIFLLLGQFNLGKYLLNVKRFTQLVLRNNIL
jgi:glycosyltransferase involved in cell wall biosynthesis